MAEIVEVEAHFTGENALGHTPAVSAVDVALAALVDAIGQDRARMQQRINHLEARLANGE